jgi:uncharacterized protein
MKMTFNIICLIMMFANCRNGDTTHINKSMLLGNDYRLFANTAASELANAVKNQDTDAIKNAIKIKKVNVDYPDPIYGQTMLNMAVFNHQYKAVKTLLEMGANPNKQTDSDRMSPLMRAAELGGGGYIHKFADSRYLKLLLKFGGNPNAVQDGDKMVKRERNYFTPLELACRAGLLENVKILVDAGADVNLDVHGNSPLFAAVISQHPDIVLFLLNKGATYDKPLYTTAKGKTMFILDAINDNWRFDSNSIEFEKEQEIKTILATGLKK